MPGCASVARPSLGNLGDPTTPRRALFVVLAERAGGAIAQRKRCSRAAELRQLDVELRDDHFSRPSFTDAESHAFVPSRRRDIERANFPVAFWNGRAEFDFAVVEKVELEKHARSLPDVRHQRPRKTPAQRVVELRAYLAECSVVVDELERIVVRVPGAHA